MSTLTSEARAALRAKFKPGQVSWRPRITCPACEKGWRCQTHTLETCAECGVKMTTAHDHLPYVGQDQVRARLDEVDPDWTWEPMALTTEGVPVVDAHGGLWIRLTVCGVVRIGYGAPEKGREMFLHEAIGKAIRFTARDEFGVGLYLLEAPKPRKPKTSKAATCAAVAPPPVEDVPLPFPEEDEVSAVDPRPEQEKRDSLRQEIRETAQRLGMDIPALAQDFHGFSDGRDLTDCDLDLGLMGRFLEYLRHPEPQAVA